MRRDLPLIPGDPRHGTPGGYTNHGCRCPSCTGAHSADAAYFRANRYAKAIPPEVEHGLACYSNWGCRCEVCTEANRRRAREARARAKLRAAGYGQPT